MRLTADFNLKADSIPIDYRSGFISLFKKALEKSNPLLFEQYYGGKKVIKPFTWSVYFPQLHGNQDGQIVVGEYAKLNFSTCSMELATHLYNGLRSIPLDDEFKNGYPLFNNALTLRDINLKPPLAIKSDRVTFKTISPVLVNCKGNSDRYLMPDDEGFIDGLEHSVRECAKEFLGQENIGFAFELINRPRRKVVRHYGGNMSAFTGVFRIDAPLEVLQLIYDVGLGVRRSQGFGMLEVVR